MSAEGGPDVLVTHPTVTAGGAGGAGGELGRRLLAAARAGHTDAVLELMAAGAPFAADWLGTSALHLAAGAGHAAVAGVLLRAGVSRDARNKVERTALHVAAEAGRARVAALLVEAGAAVDARDMLQMTPLHWAVQRGHAATARLLLQRGADPAPASKFRLTPRDIALRLGRADLVHMLDDAIASRAAEPRASPPPARSPPRTPTPPQKQEPLKKPRVNKQPAEHNPEKEQGSAAALLRAHGITLLPADHPSTVLNALQSGRTVVLSDAGKLMLQESGGAARPSPAPLNLLALNNNALQVKNLKAKNKVVRISGAPGGARAGAGLPVKIIVNKDLTRLLINNKDNSNNIVNLHHKAQGAGGAALCAEATRLLSLSEEQVCASSPRALLAHALAARRLLRRLVDHLQR